MDLGKVGCSGKGEKKVCAKALNNEKAMGSSDLTNTLYY